eukprot:4118304-Pleurochrysis_carterae.AAC.1
MLATSHCQGTCPNAHQNASAEIISVVSLSECTAGFQRMMHPPIVSSRFIHVNMADDFLVS